MKKSHYSDSQIMSRARHEQRHVLQMAREN